MKNIKMTIGNSNVGYNTAELTKTTTGKYRIVVDSISGNKTVLKKCVALLNKGHETYVKNNGDEFPISLN